MKHSSDLVYLQITKFLRSVGQGALLVSFALYLDALGWSAEAIGTLLAGGGLAHSLLSFPVGTASDRFGRKPFVVGSEVALLLAAAVALVSDQPLVLGAASIVGAFGRGQVGTVGPAAPAEQAWIAQLVPREKRGRVYSTNAALGFLGTGLGSAVAAFIPLWDKWLPGPLAYRPLFLLVFVASTANLILLLRVSDARRRARPAAVMEQEKQAERMLTRQEHLLMAKMAAINSVNGLAIGLTSPLLSYWFALRFGVGPGAIGVVFAATYLVTAAASLAAGRITERIGIVRSVVTVRVISVFVLLFIPIVPWFWLASTLYVLRSALNRSTQGSRQALAVSVVRQERRGLASSLNTLSMSLPNAAGPVLAGILLGAGLLTIPFYAAAGLQFAYGVLFGRVFAAHDIKPSVER